MDQAYLKKAASKEGANPADHKTATSRLPIF